MTDEDERGAASPDAADQSASAATEEWQFDPADFDDPDAADAADDEDADADGNVAGSLFELEDEIEPGTPSLEGTMFVVLGALATILFLLEAGGAI